MGNGLEDLYKDRREHAEWLRIVDDAAWHTFISRLKSRRSFEVSFEIVQESGRLQLKIRSGKTRAEADNAHEIGKLIPPDALVLIYKKAIEEKRSHPAAPKEPEAYSNAAEHLLDFKVEIVPVGDRDLVLKPSIVRLTPDGIKKRAAELKKRELMP